MSYSRQAEDIQQQMTCVRCNLNEEMGEIVGSARVMSDWHYYMKTYPWLCLGAVLAVGYLVVPARLQTTQPNAQTLAKSAKRSRWLVRPQPEIRSRSGLAGSVVSLLAGMLARRLVSYAEQSVAKVASRALRSRHGDAGSHSPQGDQYDP